MVSGYNGGALRILNKRNKEINNTNVSSGFVFRISNKGRVFDGENWFRTKKKKEKERLFVVVVKKTYNRQELTFVSIRFATTWNKMENKTKGKINIG